MFRVELKEDGITGALSRAAALLDDLAPVMQDIGDLLLGSTKARFGLGEAPDGTKWAAKSKATLEKYARGKGKVQTRPLFGPNLRLSREIGLETGADFLELGSVLPYAAVMQFGAEAGQFGAAIGRNKLGRDYFMPIPWGNIPARPFLGVSEQDRADIGAEIAKAMAGAFGQA